MSAPPSAEIKMFAHKAKLLSAFKNTSKLPPAQKDNAGNWNLQRSISARLWANILTHLGVQTSTNERKMEEDGRIWYPRTQRTHEGF